MQFIALPIKHFKFLKTVSCCSRSEIALSSFLAFGVVLMESLGLASLFPIISFIENGRDIAQFVNASKINYYMLKAFTFFGIDISLPYLMIVAVILITIRQSFNYYNMVFLDYLKWTVGKRVGRLVFRKLMLSEPHFLRTIKGGEFTLLADHESQAVASLIPVYIGMIQMSLAFSMVFAIMLTAAPLPSIFVMSLIVVLTWSMKSFFRHTNNFASESVVLRKQMFNFIAERHSAWKILKLSKTVDAETDNFSKCAGDIVEMRVKMTKTAGKLALVFVPVITTVMMVVIFALLEVFLFQISTLVVFALFMARMIPLAQSYQRRYTQLLNYSPSLSRIEEILNSAEMHAERDTAKQKLKSTDRAVTFDNVSFMYQGQQKPVFRSASLKIPDNELVGIIGASGSGKSTLLDMIARLHTPTSGTILLGGVPIDKISLAELRENIALITQEPFLFNDTLKNNLAYGNGKVSDKTCHDALRKVNMLEFYQNMPKFLGEMIADKGGNLSVGQRQRIAIARALISKAKLYLFDEPTSALDSVSENEIVKLFNVLVASGKTVIVVAHRLNTLQDAKAIIKIENGDIIQFDRSKQGLSGLHEISY
ncbi:ABC transporter ATP-binding protein/permease [Alphaproteobacteria bacterium]|nr:ABC transporter ATP-binding protein/permease [Alphaproteobacteria bacterium]